MSGPDQDPFAMTYQNPYNPVFTHVELPFSNPIVGGLAEGKQIQIQGIVQDAERFSVNLCLGPEIRPDCALHLNPRFNEGCIVRNALVKDEWGDEERAGNLPLKKGQMFEMIIMATSDAFLVAVNGQHFTSFKYRIPLEKVQYIFIEGGVKINFIKFEGGQTPVKAPLAPGYAECPQGPGPIGPPPAYGMVGLPPPPLYSPGGFVAPSSESKLPSGEFPPARPPMSLAVPFKYSIPGGMAPNRMIFISGTPKSAWVERATVNLLSPDDNIPFHFDIRFNYGGERNKIVRNTQAKGQWGQEERNMPSFPFVGGKHFDIIILATPECFKVAVDNVHFIAYNHRVPLSEVFALEITGDVTLSNVRFQ